MRTLRTLVTSSTLNLPRYAHSVYVYSFSKYTPLCAIHLQGRFTHVYNIHYLMTGGIVVSHTSLLLCPENVYPEDATSTAESKQSPVRKGPVFL